MRSNPYFILLAVVAFIRSFSVDAGAADHLRDLQTAAIEQGHSPAAHWGNDPEKYRQWGSHSLRLVLAYAFGTRGAGTGVDLDGYLGENSIYRSEAELRRVYGFVPSNTLNSEACYCDQTDIAELQRAAIRAGKKFVFLVVFDGMDWQTTQAAAIYRSGNVDYSEGRGSGLHFLDYTAGGNTQYGAVCTAPHNGGTKTDVDAQTVLNPGGTQPGGYDPVRGGAWPWSAGSDHNYRLGLSSDGSPGEHVYPDSSSTATALCTGVKTYNSAVGVDPSGEPVVSGAHEAQERGWSIGLVTSVPISHATPASAYAHNVNRSDYQDLTRDLLGRPSISHPDDPLPGVDVLIGGGWGMTKSESKSQGQNFVPGNPWLAEGDLAAIDADEGGRYVVGQRTAGAAGRDVSQEAADRAAGSDSRLFGFFGVGRYGGHLPYQTADGDYRPAPGKKGAEEYSDADVTENPTLSEMTQAALTVLERNQTGFWMMVEAGDVDWANHANNLDNSIGAVISGDEAVQVITDWVESHSNWDESLLIVTADHGHDLNLLQPAALVGP